MSAPLAFYDLDGTLVSSNVVTQYAWFARHQPSRLTAAWKMARLLLSVPFLIGLDLYSRRLFNIIFYQEYRGLRKDWLQDNAERMFSQMMRPAVYPRAKALIDADKSKGYRTVLITGSLDFALEPVKRYFGFDEVVCNKLEFRNGVATGRMQGPVIAGAEKVDAIRKLCGKYNVETVQCKAYSDSLSDLPMLEAVGLPAAANPDRRLARYAARRGWPILNLKEGSHVHTD